MSFLQELQKRKKLLRNTDTLVRCADGTRYIERHSSSNNARIIPQKSTIGFVVDSSPDDVAALVLPNLWLGSQECCGPDAILNCHIECVLSVGIRAPCILPSVHYTHVPCLDLPDTDLLPIIAECNRTIATALAAHRNVLVHCNAGVSRSAAIVIGYLMLEQRMSYEQAYQLVKSVRPCIQPNAGFVAQLQKLHL